MKDKKEQNIKTNETPIEVYSNKNKDSNKSLKR